MKKTLLLLFISLFVVILQAQNEVTIGTGTTMSHDVGPVYISTAGSSYLWSNHISLYTPAEIGAANVSLSGFSWNKADANGYTFGNAEFRIYVKHSSSTSIPTTSSTFATEVAGATLVYESTSQDLPLAAGWVDFDCNTANNFVYNGTDNLMILVDWYRPGAPTAGVDWYYTATTGMGQTWSGPSTPSTIAYGTDERPNIKIRYIPTPTVTPTSITMSCGDTAVFTASGSTDAYEWYSDSLGQNIIGSDSVLNLGPLCDDATVYVAAIDENVIYNFTNCGATADTGPTQAAVNTEYSGTNLDGDVTITTQGIQEWTVPTTGVYTIEAYGAQGYGPFGGRGAYMSGEFSLTAGTVLKILVGQEAGAPLTGVNQYGGGGGSFVTYSTNIPLIIAGGGGGNWATAHTTTTDAPTSNNGNNGINGSVNGAGGTVGSGGATASSADGGGGLTGDGGGTFAGGSAFVNGGEGGAYRGVGGFGGGGGTSSWDNRRCGGGGGYSGGGASASTSSSSGNPEGGGGGSYNDGTLQNNLAGVNTGHGSIRITFHGTGLSSPLASAQITILPISNPVVTSPVSVCEMDSILLTASGSTGNYLWFADSLGTTLLENGPSYQTGAITSDTIIYVQAYSDSIEHTYSFTNCGVTGRTGPTQADIDAAYGPSLLNGKVDINTQGIQEWIVPFTATYTIEVAGAQGGGIYGGLGANMQGDFMLTAGDTLKILVGQTGTSLTSSRGDYSGGGGSFVTNYSNSPLIIAGGGGGAEVAGAGSIGQTTIAGSDGTGGNFNGVGGTAGGGGTYDNQTTDGGAGLLTDGGSGNPNPAPQSFLNGGEGGSNSWSGIPANGGFGGGGSSNRNDISFHGAGGGGGYSGGGSSYANNGTSQPIAGGGGSYNIGTNQTNIAGTNMGHGYVKITVTAPICFSDIVPIEINVDTLPEISTQPVDVAITEGNNASFTITAVGTGISYQWQESTDSSTTWTDLSNNATYSGVNTASLTISSASLSMDNYYYRCIVDGTCPPPDTSNAGILEVNSTGIDSEAFNSINVYPNPVKTKLIVEIDSKTNEEAIVSVFDVVGNLLLEHKDVNLVKGSNRIEINMESLANGIYYLRIIAATEQQQFSIIKN